MFYEEIYDQSERWSVEQAVMINEAENDEIFKIRFSLEKEGEYTYD